MSVTTRVVATDEPPRAEDILAFEEHERMLLVQRWRRVAPLAMVVVALTEIAAWITPAFGRGRRGVSPVPPRSSRTASRRCT